MFVFPVYSIVFWWFSSKGWDASWHFQMRHSQPKFSDIHVLHGIAATASTTTTITSHPPLSPTTVTTTTTDESFIFTSSTQFLKSRRKASLCFIFPSSTFSLWGKSQARKLHFHIFHSVFEVSQESFVFTSSTFSSNNSFRNIWALPCLSLACCSSWTSKARKKKTFFQRSMGQRLADRDYVIVWFLCRYGWRIVWDTWLDQKNLQNNVSGKSCFWKFLLLSWTKLEAAAENEKHKLQKE